jgi:hypothetical protein
MVRASPRERGRLRGAIDGEVVSRGSSRLSGDPPGEDGVVLLGPRLLPLSDEERAEAVTLLSELLLAAARRGADGHNLPTDGAEGSSRRRALAAGDLGRDGLAA